jgi:hypothetical protein
VQIYRPGVNLKTGLGRIERVGMLSALLMLAALIGTLTTTSVSDPDLVLTDGWLKLFTVFYQLIGIGILVEVLRRLGIAFITVRAQEKSASRSGGAPESA